MDQPFPSGMTEHIEGLLANDGMYPCGLDYYPHIFDSDLMFPLQRIGEMRWMLSKAWSICPETVLDIGSDKGGGLYHWCKGLTTLKTVIACEIRGLPYASAFEKAFPHIRFLWIEDSSYAPQTVKRVEAFLNDRPIDVAFLDGDKSYFDADFNCYHTLVRPGGLVFVHDIQDEAPRDGYNKILAHGYGHEEFIDKTDTAWTLDRERRNIPPSTAHEKWLRHWRGRSCGVGLIYL